MKGDFTRWTYSPAKNYSAVLLQQGRVLLDADWNEQRALELASRRQLAKDLIGPAAGPLGATGFAITTIDDGAALALAAGRYYVDGILCELHQDTALAEQPDLPGVDPCAGLGPGRYLVYLDVWEQHVTAIEDGEIKEKALGGVDHTTRARVRAQARLWPVDGLADECATVEDPRALAALIEGPRGRLTAAVDPAPVASDPCMVPASAGFRGLENQLYRVEIHRGGEVASEVRFKWSRDNGSVVTAWDAHPDPDGDPTFIEVADLGPDDARGFRRSNLLVELLDDGDELAGRPGVLARIANFDEASRALELADPIDGDGNPATIVRGDDDLHPRVRRWDCARPRTLDEVDDHDGDGDWLALEDGLRVRFELGGGRRYRSGDFWLIPARTVDGTIAWAPEGPQEPHGVGHRYAGLAIVARDEQGKWTILRSCQRRFPGADSQIQLHRYSGDGQQGPLGAQLPAPLAVQVRNGAVPVAGAQVRFAVTDPGSNATLHAVDGPAMGSVLTLVTDGAGRAAVRLTMADEASWAGNPGLITQHVDATLLDACGEPSEQRLGFVAHESQAVEVRYDLERSEPLAKLHDHGTEADQVQAALELLVQNPHLSYVGGDGQEGLPGQQLPVALAVRVGNGAWPMAKVAVRFELFDHRSGKDADDDRWAGSLSGDPQTTHLEELWPGGTGRALVVTSDDEGVAWVRWTLGEVPGQFQPGVRARIVLAKPFDLFSPGQPICFAGRWSLASAVGYAPACAHLGQAGVTTVQQALDHLCLDRTLYYVSGTGQPGQPGQVLPAPLIVRVASEGQPIADATVEFEIVGLSPGPLDQLAGGVLQDGGWGALDLVHWGGGGIRRLRAKSDGAGLVGVRWVYPLSAGATLAGVRATLLKGSAATTSVVAFSALRQSGQADEDGVHVVETVIVDRDQIQRPLINDSTVDPHHLLNGVLIRCDRALDPHSVLGRGTTALRVEVPYGWSPSASVLAESDPYFAPSGVQHYDRHTVAGAVDLIAAGQQIRWTPTSAARRMLVGSGGGPLRSALSELPSPLPVHDWPLPVRLLSFGAGEQRVRATLDVEGNFIVDAQGTLHLDGDALGAPGSEGNIALALPSGDGRVGGDFHGWFWLEARIWQGGSMAADQLTIDAANYAIVGTPLRHPNQVGVDFDLGVAVVVPEGNKGNLALCWCASNHGTVQQSVWGTIPVQAPQVWPRRVSGAPQGYWVGFFDVAQQPRVLRVERAGNIVEETLGLDIDVEMAPASCAPAGAQTNTGFAYAWCGGSRLYVVVRVGNGGNVTELGQWFEAKYQGQPAVVADVVSGELRVFCQAEVDGKPALLQFTHVGKDDSWAVVLLSDEKEWQPAVDGRIAVAANRDAAGAFVVAIAWHGAEELLVLRQRDGQSWRIDRPRQVVACEADKDTPLACAVDGQGVIHVVLRGQGSSILDEYQISVLDLWSDHRTPWTLTDVRRRVGMHPVQPGLRAGVTGDGGHLLIAGVDVEQPVNRLNLAWFGLPRAVAGDPIDAKLIEPKS